MANGRQLTPFDTTDLGGQLLQALVQGQATKEAKEQQKLREKELALQEKLFQLQGLQQVAPESRGDILSNLFGQQVQPYVSPQEQSFADLQGYLEQNPEIRDMYMRLQATGQLLPPEEALEGARVASGAKLGKRDRLNAFLGLMDIYGSPAAKSAAGFFASELGARPIAGRTLGEQGLDLQREQLKGASKADEIRARKETLQFLASGFRPAPGSPDEQDPELFQRHLDEYLSFGLAKSPTISPEAAMGVSPVEAWAKIMKASAEPSPELSQSLIALKALTEAANMKNVKPTREMLDRIQELHQRVFELSLQPEEEGGEPPPAEESSGWLQSLLGVVTGPDFTTMTLGGRPLKPEIAEALNIGQSATRPTGVLSSTLALLDAAYQKVLPLITTDPSKPPTRPPTLGALSGPEAQAIPQPVRDRLLSLVFSAANLGLPAEEAAQMEREMVQVFTRGTPEQQQEYVDLLLDDIEELRKENR